VSVAAFLKASLAAEPDLTRLSARRVGDWIFDDGAWAAMAARACAELEAYHRAHALRQGMPREELRSRLGLQGGGFGAALKGVAGDRGVQQRGGGPGRRR